MKTTFFTTTVVLISTLLCLSLQAQTHQVTLSSNNATPNNCGARNISAQVTGGSGSYTYFWSAMPPTGINLGNSPNISVSPSETTVFTTAVQDNGTGQFATASITIGRILTGSFSVSIPGTFTPNGDGINDTWDVMDGNNSNGPVNAYGYELTIRNGSNQIVFNRIETLTTGIDGIHGGYISWNGRVNGNGNFVPNGFYTYSLKLQNCSGNQTYQGTIIVLGVSFSMEQLLLYPNPAIDYVEVLYTEADDQSEFEITVRNKNGMPVIMQKSSQALTRLDVQTLEKGLYFVELHVGKEMLTTRLMIDR